MRFTVESFAVARRTWQAGQPAPSEYQVKMAVAAFKQGQRRKESGKEASTETRMVSSTAETRTNRRDTRGQKRSVRGLQWALLEMKPQTTRLTLQSYSSITPTCSRADRSTSRAPPPPGLGAAGSSHAATGTVHPGGRSRAPPLTPHSCARVKTMQREREC